jgi:death on curing protein
VSEPLRIEEADATAIHDRLVAEHGRAAGLRDAGLLRSALARPQQLRSYSRRPTIIDLAAAYITGIVRNHPFIDGNKRTAFVVGVLFLELTGCRFTATEPEAARAMLDLAAGTIGEAPFAAWLRDNVIVE